MKDYLEIRVRIIPQGGTAPESGASATQRPRYVAIVESDEGQGERAFELPFELSALVGVVFGVAEKTRTAGEVEDVDTPVASALAATGFGEQLFDALFKEATRDKLKETIAVARRLPDTGTRIRLLMNLETPGMAQVASLPWELMRDKGDRDPLVVSDKTPLVRSIDVGEPTDPRPFQPPLRIMVIMSNPTGTLQLNLAEERDRVEKAWANSPGRVVDFVNPVEEDIKHMLSLAEYHVIHYMGHGDSTAKGGVLLLEKRDRSEHRVPGEEFARWLKSEPLRLVFLNACKTAATSVGNANPFAGVATALIRAGAPAVVAMQFPISDEAAIVFAKTFYERIEDGIPVDAAVAMARAELRTPEWATPVLFMRSKDGRLFERVEVEVAAPGTSTSTAQTAAAAPDPWPAGAADAHRVFLAAPSDDLRRWHKQLIRELGSKGVRVIHTLPPALSAKDHTPLVTTIVRSADLCVHLIGEDPGEEMDGEPSSGRDTRPTYAWEQCRIGLDAARSQLVLMDEAKKVESVQLENEAWSAYVRSLVARPRGAARFQVIHTDKNRMTDDIMTMLEELKKAREAARERGSSGGTVRRAFVDAHRTDFKHAQVLESFLIERNIDVEKKTSSDSPTDAMQQFDVNLSKYPLYILVAGSADKAWVENREEAALKSAVKSRAKILIGRYAAGKGETPEDPARAMRLLEIVAEMNGFDSSSVESLIGPAAAGTP